MPLKGKQPQRICRPCYQLDHDHCERRIPLSGCRCECPIPSRSIVRGRAETKAAWDWIVEREEQLAREWRGALERK